MKTYAALILSGAHLKAIGAVAAEWAFVEMAMEMMIWGLIPIDNNTGYRVTAHIGSETRLHILGALAEVRISDPVQKKLVAQLITDIRRLRTERNNIVHSVWLTTQSQEKFMASLLKNKGGRKPTPASIRVSAKGSLKFTHKPYPSKRIMGVAQEIDDLRKKLFAYLGVQNEEREKNLAKLAAALGSLRLVQTPDPIPIKVP